MLKGVAASNADALGITSLTGDVTATGPGAAAATLVTAQPAVHTWALAQTFTTAPVFPTAISANQSTAIPSAGDVTVGLKATSTANFGVFFGSGAPTLSAAKGSLYLRSDGSGVNDRAYIATNASGTWTALVTAG